MHHYFYNRMQNLAPTSFLAHRFGRCAACTITEEVSPALLLPTFDFDAGRGFLLMHKFGASSGGAIWEIGADFHVEAADYNERSPASIPGISCGRKI